MSDQIVYRNKRCERIRYMPNGMGMIEYVYMSEGVYTPDPVNKKVSKLPVKYIKGYK